jgi:aminopeptidase
MTDPRYNKLAKLLVEYSTQLKAGDKVLIDAIDIPDDFTVELMRTVRKAGATPLVEVRHGRVTREVLRGTDEVHATTIRDIEMFRMKRVQAYIALRGSANINESSDVDSSKMALYSRIVRPVLNYRVNKTRWVVLRWPTPSMAQAAGHEHGGVRGFLLQRLHHGLRARWRRPCSRWKSACERPIASTSRAPAPI